MKKIELTLTSKLILVTVFMATIITTIMLYFYSSFNIDTLPENGLASSSRLLNGFFAALLTSMALIVTLTANLYSPRLVKVFVRHPLTVTGISFILLSDMMMVLTHLTSLDHPLHEPLVLLSFYTCLLAICGMIPYLYYVSQFIRPAFFIPLLKSGIVKGIKKAQHDNGKQTDITQFFDSIDVIANIASTGMRRDDKKLITLVLDTLNDLLHQVIEFQLEHPKTKWRRKSVVYPPGMSEEGKYFLKKTKNWPEAYLLTKILHILNNLDKHQNNIIPLACSNLLKTLDMCNDKDRNDLIELQLMVYNSLLQHSIDAKNISRVNSIFYYYRLSIELLMGNKIMREYSIGSYIHYGKQVLALEYNSTRKCLLYDIGRIINFISFESEELATSFYNKHAKELWELSLMTQGKACKIARSSLVKTYWGLKSQNCHKLADMINEEFLENEPWHPETIDYLLSNNNPLNREFNYRLMRPDFISGMAKKLAQDFLTEKTEAA
jgi:hypothetical protein